MEAKERTARLPQWLERMTRVGSADQPARVIFDRPDGTVADMSVDSISPGGRLTLTKPSSTPRTSQKTTECFYVWAEDRARSYSAMASRTQRRASNSTSLTGRGGIRSS